MRKGKIGNHLTPFPQKLPESARRRRHCDRSGSFGSVKDVEPMQLHLAGRNLEPVRYEWETEGTAILEKIRCARAAREMTESNNG